jgi:hypothetical protein
LRFSFTLFTAGLITDFAYPIWHAPLLDLQLENLDEDLECYLRPVSFVLPSHFCGVVLFLIDHFISRVLALSEKQCEKRAAESVQVAKIVELEVVARSQADKITELEATCNDLKCEKAK